MIQFCEKENRIIRRGRSYDNIFSAIINILSVTKNMDESTDSILQYIISLSSENLKNDFINMGLNISNLIDQKKEMVTVETARRWGKDVIK